MARERSEWDTLLTAQEVADLLRVHIDTFRRWCSHGQGPCEMQVGAVKRYAESDVRRWIHARQSRADEVA